MHKHAGSDVGCMCSQVPHQRQDYMEKEQAVERTMLKRGRS